MAETETAETETEAPALPPSPVARAIANTTYREVARVAGVTELHVARVFRGERNPSLRMAGVLARVLGVTIDELHKYLETVVQPAAKTTPTVGRKLTEEQAERGREMVREGKLKYREIGDALGVSAQTVSNLAHGLHYRTCPPDSHS